MRIEFKLNGTPISIDTPGDRRVIDLLREDLRLTGTKEGCGKGECGACTILLENRAVNACLLLACQLEGHEVTTVESLSRDEELDPLQKAFLDAGAVQCGFCIPGMVMAAKALLNETPRPTREEIRHAMAGNLCRCTGYAKVVDAIELASRRPS